MMANFFLRSIYVLGSMYALLFGFVGAISSLLISDLGITIGEVTVGPWVFAIIIVIAFALIQFLISPFFMDLQLRWFYGVNWISPNQLPAEMRDAILASMQKYAYNIGKIGIIQDGTPNAFTYGRFRNGARVVFTQGIIDILEPKERVAVLEHELAHILNGDFLFMTMAQVIPVLFYGVYIQSRLYATHMSRVQRVSSGKQGNATQGIVGSLYAISISAYIIWLISDYLVAYLSRLRESSADVRSVAETQNPNSLSSALVKIAYGLVVADAETQRKLDNKEVSREDRNSMKRQQGLMYGFRAMGISDIKTARGLVMTSYGSGSQQVNPEVVAAAASWDLSTPWAKYVELSSTHPLTGKRLKVLKDLAPTHGQDPIYPTLGKISLPENLWDEFVVDLFVMYIVPATIIFLPLIAYLIGLTMGINPLTFVGGALVIVGLLWLLRTGIQYPNVDHILDPKGSVNTVVEALTTIERDSYYEASPIRGKPIVIEGVVRGRGDPGYFLGDDFVVQDKTGFIRVNYKSIFSLYGMWFGYKHVRNMMGTKVRVVGWYHRGVAPYIVMYQLFKSDGKTHKNRWRGANMILSYLFLGIGIIVALSSLGYI